MKLAKGNIYVPKEGKTGKVKYLCICAHTGDCESMAIDGIQRGYRAKKYSFACVVSADGSDVAKTGKYSEYTDGQMRAVRASEQKKAAELGRYNSLYFLKYDTSEIRDPENEAIINDYVAIIKELKPRIIYTHSVLDADPDHISVAVKVINALRKMKKGEQPTLVYGCEANRSLDWVNPAKIVAFDVSKNVRLQKELLNVHHTQQEGVKDLCKAAMGRRLYNSLYNTNTKSSDAKLVSRAINMTTLMRRKELPIKRFAMSYLDDIYGMINDAMDIAL